MNKTKEDILQELKGRYADVHSILAERERSHGSFQQVALVEYRIRQILHETDIYDLLSPMQTIAIDMIMAKVARITCGNPNFKDHWYDIAGYAMLGAQA